MNKVQLAVLTSLILSTMTTLPASSFAQVFDEKFDTWPVETSIQGSVILAPNVDDLTILKKLIRPTSDDSVVRHYASETVSAESTEQLKSVFEPAVIQSRSEAKGVSHRETLVELLSGCDVLCWHTTSPIESGETSAVLECRDILKQFVRRKGVIVLIGPIADYAGASNVSGSRDDPAHLGLIANALLASNFVDTDQRWALQEWLSTTPRQVGLGIEPNTAVVLNARRLRVAGEGKATALLPAGLYHEAKQQSIAEATSRRQSPKEFMLDWTQWRRKAIDRTLPQFPPSDRQVPFVENGTLVIVGGGGMPEGLMARIIELAGGPETAKMVYVPCVEEEEVSAVQGTVVSWKKSGVKHTDFIHTKDRNKANSDEQFLLPLKDATGLWFGGGRQWNFADSYYGTKAHELMKDVLRRGGVIGGSSAGASIQGQYLARATPIENFDIMAPGYERGGLGFLTGVAIDQHFSQRGRQKDMTQLVERYPQLLGIGLDEATAIIVQKSTAEVVGRGKVFFYDRSKPANEDGTDYVALPEGSSYDLATRTVILDATPTEARPTTDGDQ